MNNVPVYVQSRSGKPLLPTVTHKAKKLLKQNKAIVIHRRPFTIRLINNTCEFYKQELTLGIDFGLTTGFSVCSDDFELISGDYDISLKDKCWSKKYPERMSERINNKSIYRRLRRGRLRYRQARFNNRKRKDGWIPPSLDNKITSIISLINFIRSILPITKIIIETATFDIQKMENPEISGVEYQHGTLYGTNVKSYLLDEWEYKCVYCGKKDVPLEVEHINPKSRGGSDRVKNLTIACHECNQKKGNKTAEEFGYPHLKKPYKDGKIIALMNTTNKKLIKDIKLKFPDLEVKDTRGYITKHERTRLGLEKSHINDAFVIAGGQNQKRCQSYDVIKKRRNNRVLQKNPGDKKKGMKNGRWLKKKKNEFIVGDLIKYNEKIYICGGMSGNRVYLKDDKTLKYANPKTIHKKHVTILKYSKGLMWDFKKE